MSPQLSKIRSSRRAMFLPMLKWVAVVPHGRLHGPHMRSITSFCCSHMWKELSSWRRCCNKVRTQTVLSLCRARDNLKLLDRGCTQTRQQGNKPQSCELCLQDAVRNTEGVDAEYGEVIILIRMRDVVDGVDGVGFDLCIVVEGAASWS
eukprot:5757319-Amphidinium_carterae.1